MNLAKKGYCRVFQTAFRAALPLLPYREPEILHDMDEVAQLCTQQGIERVLVVTDPGIAKLHLANGLLDALAQANIEAGVYDRTVANPTVANVEAARALYLARDCQALIGFGGGSSMDCAKATAARIAKPKQTLDRMRGILKVHAKTPLLIAVPTTAGTGSEVTVAAVITDGETHYKYPINDFCLIPDYAVHDYRVTLGLPKQITATTGMDTLTHAVEAYIGRSTTKRTRQLAEQAVALVHGYLMRAYEDGNDVQARQNMQLAAYDAGIAFTQSYVGYVHGLAHALGGQYGTPHGLANAVITPHFLHAYGPAITPKLAHLARRCAIAPGGADDTQAAASFITWVEQMNAHMGIPRYIEGIQPEDIPTMAVHADAESNPLYPVPVEMDTHELAHMFCIVGHLEPKAALKAAQAAQKRTKDDENARIAAAVAAPEGARS